MNDIKPNEKILTSEHCLCGKGNLILRKYHCSEPAYPDNIGSPEQPSCKEFVECSNPDCILSVNSIFDLEKIKVALEKAKSEGRR